MPQEALSFHGHSNYGIVITHAQNNAQGQTMATPCFISLFYIDIDMII